MFKAFVLYKQLWLTHDNVPRYNYGVTAAKKCVDNKMLKKNMVVKFSTPWGSIYNTYYNI
jgi:hypothetical protein